MEMATKRNLHHHDYTVAWVCALPLEMAAAKAMLDEIHPGLPTSSSDQNTYELGRIHAHNVVIACLPAGVYGTTSAATVATQMLSTFTSIRFGLMVGIGGGVPSKENNIRLGDIVVSQPTRDFGGVVQYDFGKTIGQDYFERTGRLNRPPQILLTAIAKLQADQMLEASRIPDLLSKVVASYPSMQAKFTYPGQDQDVLFDSAYNHPGLESTCDACDISRLVTRSSRAGHEPVIHYGVIASGNQVIKHAGTRDKIAQDLGILCFEMEAAGLMDNFPCLVIRGICDYADSHKNKQWQGYAAAAAATYAKELLSVIHPNQVTQTPAAVLSTDYEPLSKSFVQYG
jgi:nucleoside phosphorylase